LNRKARVFSDLQRATTDSSRGLCNTSSCVSITYGRSSLLIAGDEAPR